MPLLGAATCRFFLTYGCPNLAKTQHVTSAGSDLAFNSMCKVRNRNTLLRKKGLILR